MKKDVIYLHFLNRELYRELKINRQTWDKYLAEILKILWLTSYEPMVTSIAFVWEIYLDYPCTRKLLIEFLKNNLLQLISAFYTIDELIASNQKLYRDERERYTVYFSKIPHILEKFQPEIQKKMSTTIVLEKTLTQWVETTESALFSTDLDGELIKNEGSQIKTALLKRENRAITLSLFENVNDNICYKKQLARNLSLIHINNYMQAVNGDIVTGVKYLEFYERLAVEFPIHDLILNREIIIICDDRVIEDKNFLELIQNADVQLKSAFVMRARGILKALYTICKKRNYEWYSIRYAMLNRLREVAGNLLVYKKESLSWEFLLFRIQQLDEHLKKKDMKYRCIRMEDERVRKIMLLCTATDKETTVVLQKSRECGLSFNIEKMEKMQVYHLGIIRNLDVFLTQTEMGTEKMGSARDKVRDLARIMEPNYILSTGICYGLKPAGKEFPDGNHIGDIIVANQMQMYETQKINEVNGQMTFIPRGDKVPVSTELLDAFHTAKQLYQAKDIKISFGLLLTGNLLVNSKTVVEKLQEIFLEPINGDMEAGGIYSACHDRDIKWIAIKSISDWGYDKTDKHQELARRNLYDFLFYVLSEGLIN